MEGKKTVALEIAEQLNWEMTDYVALSVGDGCTIAGVWKGFRDLYATGMIDRLPRLISVQAEGCCPLNRSIAENKPWRSMEENTLADSIAVGVPRNAEKALRAGNEDDARTFLQKKSTLETKAVSLNEAYQAAAENASQMRQMHDKLERDIASLRERKEAIKAKMAVAKTKERVSEIGSSYVTAQGGLDAFARMEEKANRMLDEANAKAELNTKTPDTTEDLMAKYDTGADVTDAAVEDELAAMKAKLGM
jgi:phage shock protein A